MKSVWTRDLEDQEKKKLQAAFNDADYLLKRLDKILGDKETQANKAFVPDAAWPYVSADNNGYRRAIQEVRKIIRQE